MRRELEDALLAVDLALVLDRLDASPAVPTAADRDAEALADALLAAELAFALAELDRPTRRPVLRRATSIARGPHRRGPSVVGGAPSLALA